MNKIFSLIICVLTLFSVTGCDSQDTAAEKAPLVKTQTISLGNVDKIGTYPGVVRGRYETNMSFQVGGRIIQRYVQAGDQVHAGDVLMSIDNRDVLQQSNQGEAQVAAAKAQLELSRSNLSRYSALYAQDAVPASVLDQYQTAYDAAQASYSQALAIANQGQNALGYANLVAASDGVISAVNAEAGQVVGAGQTVLTLVQTQELEAEINVPESRIGDIGVGKQATASFWSLNNQSVSGVVREISPMADKAAGTYKVRISLPQTPSGLHLGMTATISIDGMNTVASKSTAQQADDNFAILPISAIFQTSDTPQVWIVSKDDLTLSLKSVQIEDFAKDKVKVHGLSNGDIVVIAGVHKLRENTKVRLAEEQP